MIEWQIILGEMTKTQFFCTYINKFLNRAIHYSANTNFERDRTQDVVFSRLGVFIHHNPETEAQRSFAQAALNYKTKRDHARNSFGPVHQGYFERKSLKS